MPHILFLMSDTGGGHRAAVRAITSALEEQYPGTYSSEAVDVWREYYPFPLNTLPRTYARWTDLSPATYAAQYRLNDRLARNRVASQWYARATFARMARLYREHPADIVVCVHAAFVRPAVRALRRLQPGKPFLTVITDYALPHALWYDTAVDRCLVPTAPAYELGRSLGLAPPQLVLTGAPVHPRFTRLHMTRQEARANLGWSTPGPVVLLLTGGDGMGPVMATARAIDARRAIDAQQAESELVIVAGRNQRLRTELEAHQWQRPTRIYGYVDNLETLMRAADLLVTRGGPGVLTEAAAVGVPVIINSALKYQETPNVEYLTARGAAIYAPHPLQVARSVSELLAPNNPQLPRLKAALENLAQPDAIWKIVAEFHALSCRTTGPEYSLHAVTT